MQEADGKIALENSAELCSTFTPALQAVLIPRYIPQLYIPHDSYSLHRRIISLIRPKAFALRDHQLRTAWLSSCGTERQHPGPTSRSGE